MLLVQTTTHQGAGGRLWPLTLRAPALGAVWGRGRRSRRGARPPAGWAGGGAAPPGGAQQGPCSASPAGMQTWDPEEKKEKQLESHGTRGWGEVRTRTCLKASLVLMVSHLVTVYVEPLQRHLFLQVLCCLIAGGLFLQPENIVKCKCWC